ncbi:hypothetical protein Y032_0342g3043 [Ancylostoma ceylanicum]|uniref:Uncharacterized protein n=1 Tax=Ancylostoma ceylanicum TaxID=53326 RepID=A0A016RYT4_9BILA|nr:hypothetical protein Y032_0342g3043 [Ancylostoma ceylanicum]
MRGQSGRTTKTAILDVKIKQELDVHQLSLSHHIKLEATNPDAHSCPPCGVHSVTLSEYSKHVNTEEHRKKRDRMRAIIDTMDAGDDRRVHFNTMSDRNQPAGLTPNYLQPSSSFVRNGHNRRTYPAPGANNGVRPRYNRNMAHQPSFNEHRSYQQNLGSQHSNDGAEFCNHAWDTTTHPNFPRRCSPSLFEGSSPHSGDFYTSSGVANGASHGESRQHYPSDSRKSDGRTNENQRTSAESNTEQPSSSGDHPPALKRGILARLSLRIKDKASDFVFFIYSGPKSSASEKSEKSGKSGKKAKKKKSLSRSPPTPSSAKTDSPAAGTSESPRHRRAAPLAVSMKDKTKKWELVAVKGKASYLKNRSQRMLKDRMSKYRLVDSKGVIVEDMRDEPTTSRGRRIPSGNNNESNLPHLTSHIWGTGPEALPRSQQRDSLRDHPTASFVPSAPAPAIPYTPSPLISPDDSSSGYAIMRDLPMSTPKDYNSAVRAYENYQGVSVHGVVNHIGDARIPDGPFASATNTATASEAGSFSCFSGSSSLAMDSRSLASRMNLTANVNVSRCSEVLVVKEEPGESPPPDALPSPPQFDQTVLGQNSATEGRIAGDKERDEFWALGIAEHKKGHQILEARAKIERLQKELFETTSYLQKMEVEMNEILRRKSELLGLPGPSIT